MSKSSPKALKQNALKNSFAALSAAILAITSIGAFANAHIIAAASAPIVPQSSIATSPLQVNATVAQGSIAVSASPVLGSAVTSLNLQSTAGIQQQDVSLLPLIQAAAPVATQVALSVQPVIAAAVLADALPVAAIASYDFSHDNLPQQQAPAIPVQSQRYPISSGKALPVAMATLAGLLLAAIIATEVENKSLRAIPLRC